MIWTKITDERAEAILRQEAARKHAEWLENDRENIERLRKLEREIKADDARRILRRQFRYYRWFFMCLLIVIAYGLGYAQGSTESL
nr:hypothetical protein [uncultured Sphingomonas sp.]